MKLEKQMSKELGGNKKIYLQQMNNINDRNGLSKRVVVKKPFLRKENGRETADV